MRLGPSSVPPVACSDPRLALGRYGSHGASTVHPASASVSDYWVFAGCSLAGFSEAALARPLGAQLCITACFNELLAVN